MTFSEKSNYKDIVKSVLKKMHGINAPQFRFITEVFGLFLSIQGRLNFLQLARYGKRCEQTYRNGFTKDFDFLTFNMNLFKKSEANRIFIALDPSYISKSGKCTSGVGYFWSGVAGAAKWGLEITGIAAVDLDLNTAYHLEAVQTPGPKPNGGTLVNHYTQVILDRKEPLSSVSKYIVADAYFSKNIFIAPLNENGFEVISRLRNDADLFYLFNGVQKGGKGRPKKYDGKVKFDELSNPYFTYTKMDNQNTMFHGIVYAKFLKKKINLVGVLTKKNEKQSHKLYFTTDLEMCPREVLEMYGARFQIEFVFRDAKQNTGLDHCQARDPEKLYFHWNTALTSVNIAKVAHWKSEVNTERQPFSMANVKTFYHNQLLLDRFIVKFGIKPNNPKIK
jgi:hypothetical protein